MSAFDTTTELFDYFRKHAQSLGCNPCFDSNIAEIEAMNDLGADGTPRCLCKVGMVSCPCDEAHKEIEQDGMCYCEIFVRKKQ